MKYLITGGCGFLGSNLAAEVLNRGDELFVFDNLYRTGSESNLKWLKEFGKFKFYESDIRSNNHVEFAIRDSMPDVIFHLAGQVAMTTSILDPRLDFETNTLGTINLLEAIRKYSPQTIVLYSSTNKVYGDFENLIFQEKEKRYESLQYPIGFPETMPLKFSSPYGCSKGAADQYLLDYNRIYGVKTIVFRHSSMYGSNQYGTIDQGWISWFCQKALEIKKNKVKNFTICGNGKQVRDLLYVSDVVKLYFQSKDIQDAYGQAFNIGGGINNSLSLLELFEILENMLNIKMKYDTLPWRESDQKVFIADNCKISNVIKWLPKTDKNEGISNLINWLIT